MVFTTFAYAILSTMIFASSGKCQPYHSCKQILLSIKELHLFGTDSYLHSHRVYVDLLVQVVQQCNCLHNHGVNLVR